MNGHECDCGTIYRSVEGVEACQMNNHGQPRSPNLRERDLIEALRKIIALLGNPRCINDYKIRDIAQDAIKQARAQS